LKNWWVRGDKIPKKLKKTKTRALPCFKKKKWWENLKINFLGGCGG